jgi:hypothetical protein
VHRRRPTILALLTLFLAVVVSGCSSDDKSASGDESTTTTSTTAPVPVVPAVTVTARDYGFELPAVVEGGVIRMTLQNSGKFKHEAVIVGAGDTPVAQLTRDLTPIVQGEGKATPAYLRFHGGVSLVPGGATAESTLTLPVGKYVLVCTLTDIDSLDSDKAAGDAEEPSAEELQFHYERGMAAPFEVTTANAAVMPTTDGTIVAKDWSFELPPLAPGARTLTFRNDGQQDHSLAVAVWADGVSAEAAKAAFETLLRADEEHPPPDGLPTPVDVAFAGPLSAGGQATFSVDLKPNRTFVFACYLSDRSGGDLHAMGKGMVAYATTPSG